MESWVERKQLVPVAVTVGLPKEVSNVHGAWHSPSALHTMVRGRVFLRAILQTPPQWRGIRFLLYRDALVSSMGEAMKTSPKPTLIVREVSLAEVQNEEVYQEWSFVARC